MPKHIGETSLTKVFELIEEKVNTLKTLIDGKAAKSHTHAANTITGLHNCATTGNAVKIDGKTIIVASSAPTNDDRTIITIQV